MKTKLSLFALLLTFSFQLNAQNINTLVDQGVKDVYSLNFAEAETKFRSILRDNPKSPTGLFYLAMIDWWKILVNLDDESRDDLFYKKIEDIIFVCDEMLEKDPDNFDALFFKGGAIGFRGRLRSLRESWLKAADDGREALPIVNKVLKLQPNNADILLGTGIYSYYISVIPEEYPEVKPLLIFFPSGDKQQGINDLKRVATKGRFAKYEAQYFLMTLYQDYEKDAGTSEVYAKMLTDEFPTNPVFLKWRGRAAVMRGDYPLMQDIYPKLYAGCKEGKFGYTSKLRRETTYYLGFYYKALSQWDSAKVYLKECVELSKKIDKDDASGYFVNALLYEGMVLDKLGEREEALRCYNQLLDIKEYNSSHTSAKMFINEPYK
jgi:tetratricopeptide (TPR) repeat protein